MHPETEAATEKTPDLAASAVGGTSAEKAEDPMTFQHVRAGTESHRINAMADDGKRSLAPDAGFELDERERLADERGTQQDERDAEADQREVELDQRDVLAHLRYEAGRRHKVEADERERRADLRELAANERDMRADERERLADLREAAGDGRMAGAVNAPRSSPRMLS
jgi:hypothetical protein